jgi:hypothetical protein
MRCAEKEGVHIADQSDCDYLTEPVYRMFIHSQLTDRTLLYN